MSKVRSIFILLVLLNLSAWAWALAVFHRYPLLLGTAFLAYTLGLRHAVDADHVAAIDNITRKLVQEGKRPVAVGLMFSLGHSTIVLLGSMTIVASALALRLRTGTAQQIGGLIGTTISCLFLLGIAIVNLVVLQSVYRAFRKVRDGEPFVEEHFDLLFNGRGFLTRWIRPLFRMVQRSWHMYPVGLLFGLGFDTATEIGVLGISATEAVKGLAFWSVLVFPALFAAGMSLVDSTASILILGAYEWALVKPVRKLYYNVMITLASVVTGSAVGGLEALGLLAKQFRLKGAFWNTVITLNQNFGLLGLLLIGLFLAGWILSVLFYKWRGLDERELAILPENVG